MRMGSLSLAHALDILGYRAHHALEADWDDWQTLAKAVQQGFTQKDLDRVFSGYDCITDIGSFFAPDILRAYPNIRVIVIQRDFESWWASFYKHVVFPVSEHIWCHRFLARVAEAMAGTTPYSTTQRLLAKFFDLKDFADITEKSVGILALKAIANKKYEEHYAFIRRAVRPERRLEYKLGDGWGPLCQFLDLQVPNMPFPRVNDAKDHKRRLNSKVEGLIKLSCERTLEGLREKLRIMLLPLKT